jgi:hypothetical protein
VNAGLVAAATRVLEENWHGTYTVPANGLYPHQWSWDSAFIAIGLRHLSPRRAQLELDSLFGAQWQDGRLPQIVYNARRDDEYSPGASFWQSERITGSPAVPTTGLIQPANHALAALLVHQADPEESRRRDFLPRAYHHLVRWHEYLSRRRTSQTGLMFVVHPWESGMDNSPYWDQPLANLPDTSAGPVPRPDLLHAAAAERPSNGEYGKYLYLAATYRDQDCSDLPESAPFRVEDPAVNALLARSELALAEMAAELGLPSAPHSERAREITAAMETLWVPELGCYAARDLNTGDLQPYRTVSGIIPLLLPGIAHAPELLDTLTGPHFGLGGSILVPSHDLLAPTFDTSRYWRGPSWFNTAWLIATALRERGHRAQAAALAASVQAHALGSGFAEYLDPRTGASRGTRRFSWTAALSLDLHHAHRNQEP